MVQPPEDDPRATVPIVLGSNFAEYTIRSSDRPAVPTPITARPHRRGRTLLVVLVLLAVAIATGVAAFLLVRGR